MYSPILVPINISKIVNNNYYAYKQCTFILILDGS